MREKVFLFLMILILSCGSLEGEFGLKVNSDSNYRRVWGVSEFALDENVSWIYSLKRGGSSRREVGIILMKKELIWVDIQAGQDYFDSEKYILYGSIPELTAGEYKLIITDMKNENTLIAEMPFRIYEKNDE